MAAPVLAVAVVMERLRDASTWEPWRHRVVEVMPHAEAGVARCLRDDGRQSLWLHPGFEITLHADEGEGYWLNLDSAQPVWWVMWRTDEEDPARAWPERVLVSYNEAGRLLDAQERVDTLPLAPEICAWLAEFTQTHYKPEPKERKRPASFRQPKERR